VNETTEAIDPDDLTVVRFAPHLRASNWRLLAEALVWASRWGSAPDVGFARR